MSNIALNDVRVYVEMERYRLRFMALGWMDKQWERLLIYADRVAQSSRDVWDIMMKARTAAVFGDDWKDGEDFDAWMRRVLLLWQPISKTDGIQNGNNR